MRSRPLDFESCAIIGEHQPRKTERARNKDDCEGGRVPLCCRTMAETPRVLGDTGAAFGRVRAYNIANGISTAPMAMPVRDPVLAVAMKLATPNATATSQRQSVRASALCSDDDRESQPHNRTIKPMIRKLA